MQKIHGLIAAPFTPFDKRGQLNKTIIPTYAAYLKKNGVRGVFVNGTTGECASLSREERMLAAEMWVEVKDPQFKVFVQVGHDSLPEVQQLARHAEEIGSDGIGVLPPIYFKPKDVTSLVAYNIEIARMVPRLPYFYYHIPRMTGVNFPMIDFLREAEKDIPNLAGIKYSHQDFMDMKLCLEYENQKYNVLPGIDEILICGLAMGVTGAIGSTYNYINPLFLKIIESFNNGNLKIAQELQFEVIKIVQVLIKYGGGAEAGKAFMRLVGLDFGHPRLPTIRLSDFDESQLKSDLNAVGFLEHSRHIKTI